MSKTILAGSRVSLCFTVGEDTALEELTSMLLEHHKYLSCRVSKHHTRLSKEGAPNGKTPDVNPRYVHLNHNTLAGIARHGNYQHNPRSNKEGSK